MRCTLLLGVFALATHVGIAEELHPIRSACDSQLSDVEQLYQTALNYQDKEHIGGNLIRAHQCFLAAAVRGHVRSQVEVAWGYSDGLGTDEDARESTRWLEKAADAGHVASQYTLAWRYLEGEGVELDISVAVGWFRRAAHNGHADAQNALGFLLHRGEKTPKDLVEAVYWYNQAIAQQHILAMGNLAELVNARPKYRVARSLPVQRAAFVDSPVIRELNAGDLVYPVTHLERWTAVILDDRHTVGWIDNTSIQ